jgi:hypothetical protein
MSAHTHTHKNTHTHTQCVKLCINYVKLDMTKLKPIDNQQVEKALRLRYFGGGT